VIIIKKWRYVDMDNNQNNVFNTQPANSQNNVFNAQPANNQQQGQPQQGGYPYMGQPAPKKPISEYFGLISLVSGSFALLLAILGSALTCGLSGKYNSHYYATSGVISICIVAVLIAIAAIVFAVMALKKNPKDKMSAIAFVVAIFAFCYAIMPMLTVCGYNCTLRQRLIY
jgi:hypothetical protein